jgi:hypothetical protein
MNRTRAAEFCEVCNEAPAENASGALTCRCNRVWCRRKGEIGTQEEQTLLASKGFELAQDIQGDRYYIGREGQLLWLYADGEWTCDKAPPDCNSLIEYFHWRERIGAIDGRDH